MTKRGGVRARDYVVHIALEANPARTLCGRDSARVNMVPRSELDRDYVCKRCRHAHAVAQ